MSNLIIIVVPKIIYLLTYLINILYLYSSTISTPITEKVTEKVTEKKSYRNIHTRETHLFPFILSLILLRYITILSPNLYILGSECCTSLSISSTGTAFLSQPYSFGTYVLNITSHGGQAHSTHTYKKGAIIFFGGLHLT